MHTCICDYAGSAKFGTARLLINEDGLPKEQVWKMYMDKYIYAYIDMYIYIHIYVTMQARPGWARRAC